MDVLVSKTTERFTLTVKSSPDKMKLFIDVEPVGKATVTIHDLIDCLSPTFTGSELETGVLEDVAAIVSKGQKAQDRRIRKGDPGEPGVDGKLLIMVKKFTGKGEIKVDDRGYGTLTERHLFDNITVGQVIGRVYAPKPGRAGVDVLGQAITPTPGKPAKMTLDKSLTTEKSSDGDYDSLIAQREGFLLEDNGKFSIQEELLINGDLDLRLGSIDFIGAIKVRGSITSGLNVRAKKGITVGDGLQDSVLECPQGDVTVAGFAFGGTRGRIIGGKAVKVRVAQELRIESLHDIQIEKEAVDCVLRTQTQIQMPQANLVGGEAFVVCGLEANNIGNEVGKRTTIHLCSDIETSTEFATLQGSLASHDQALNLVEVHLGMYAKMPARVQLLKQPFRDRMEKLLRKREQIVASRADIAAKQKKMLDRAHRSETLRVNARGKFFPGVVIVAGEERFEVKERIDGPKTIEFSPKEKQFTVRAIEPVVCSVSFEEGEKDGTAKKES